MNNNYRDLITAIIIIILGFIFNYIYLNQFPSYIHAWAECDHYALAQGFVNNNLNFFKPETFLMNYPYPDNWEIAREYSITAVNFPLNNYIPAIIMKITDNNSVWIYRLFTLLYSFFGLFFLFKLSFLFSTNFYKSLFIVIFALTSPVFIYYQASFLPSVPSMANVIIGFYFYIKYLSTKKNKHFYLSIIFLSIAVLCRNTFAVTLATVLSFELLRILKKEVKLKHQVLPIIISFSLIICYYFYNIYLRTTFGSLFLYHSLPAQNWTQVKEIFQYVYKNWITQYFSQYHYITLIIFLFAALYYKFVKKAKSKPLLSQLSLLILIMFIGYLAFMFTMLRQFNHHDYYFLDTFYLPIILSLILFVSYIPITRKVLLKVTYAILLLTFTSLTVFNGINSQKERRTTMNSKSINFEGASSFFDSLGIPKNARITLLDKYAPNIAFTLMNRKGCVSMSYERKEIINALNWNLDYIVIDNHIYKSLIEKAYPEIKDRLNLIGNNGKISIYTLKNE